MRERCEYRGICCYFELDWAVTWMTKERQALIKGAYCLISIIYFTDELSGLIQLSPGSPPEALSNAIFALLVQFLGEASIDSRSSWLVLLGPIIHERCNRRCEPYRSSTGRRSNWGCTGARASPQQSNSFENMNIIASLRHKRGPSRQIEKRNPLVICPVPG
jgi:hypothetical protein